MSGRKLTSIKAEHLPWIENREADWLSRKQVDEGGWSLHPQVFEQIVRAFGRPDVDLFASKEKADVPFFLSRTLKPSAPMPCSFHGHGLSFMPSPFPLIQAVLQRVKKFKASLMLVAPDWPRRPWYPYIVNMAVSPPQTPEQSGPP